MKIDLKQLLSVKDVVALRQLVENYKDGKLDDLSLTWGMNEKHEPNVMLLPRIIFIIMAALSEIDSTEK